MDERSQIEIKSKLLVEKLSMFLGEKTKAYAKIYSEISMNDMITEANSYEDFKVIADTIDLCKDFAQKNNIIELLNYCTIWNKMGVEKYKTLNFGRKVLPDNKDIRYIEYHLQNFYNILTKPMKDIELISQLIPKLNEFKEYIKKFEGKKFETQDPKKILTIIEEELDMANSIVRISDELDENLRIR